MDAKIHMLPGVERADLEGAVPIDVILKQIPEFRLVDMVVVGRGMDGTIFIWSTSADGDAVVGLLTRATHRVLADPDKVYLPDVAS